MRIALPLVALLVACGSSSSSSKEPPPAASGCDTGVALPATPPTLRLPGDAAPTAYRASLTIDPGSDSFQGHIEIDLDVRHPTSVLWLNAEGLTVTSATLRARGDETPLEVVPEPHDFVGLRGGFSGGAAVVVIDYTGKQDVGRGLGSIRRQAAGDWYVVTQFEPTGARRVFPSFDEPGYKVPWTLDLTVPATAMALTNQPIASESPTADGHKKVQFTKTPPLPSYLIAFAVGPFDAVDGGKTRGGAPIHIVVPRGRGAEAAYSAAETGKIVAALEDYTGIPYPFDKLDMVAIPNGLGGAMENPGLITYGERFLLIPPGESNAVRASFVAIAAHELGHMWFGDLVTMAWWDDLWLNEAFATWIAPKVTAIVHPEFEADLDYVNARRTALEADALSTARQIRQPITADADIEAAFDGITYQKGATVIRMFEEWLGEDVFQKGARAYLTAHARGNATAADFLAALDQASGKDVTGAFSTFLDQPGEPLVELNVTCGVEGAGAVVGLTQRRFLARGAGAPTGNASWKVPVCVAAGGKRACTILDGATGSLALDTCPASLDPLPDGVGYYRAKVSGVPLAPVARPARLASFDDQLALGVAGEVDLAPLLAGAPALGGDRDLALADRVLGMFDRIAPVVAAGDRAAFAKVVTSTFGAAAKRLGWQPRPDDGVLDARLHTPVMSMVAVHGDDRAAQAGAVALAKAWLKDPTSLPTSIWLAVLGTAVEASPAELVAAISKRAPGEKESRIARPMYQALARAPDAASYDAALAMMLAGDALTADVLGVLRRPWRVDQQARQFAFVRDHWDDLVKRTPDDFQGQLVPYVCDAAKRDEVVRFLQDKIAPLPSVGALRTAQTIESIDRCIAENAALAPAVAAWLHR